jgi:Phosphotransferase enzyme family
MEHSARLAGYSAVSAHLALLSDDQAARLVGKAVPLASGIGGTTFLLDLDGTRIFVKKIPLSDLERRQENIRSTANFFRLPVFYQYGLGSTGFGAWRELALHVMTTNWVLSRQCLGFPLMYHWRTLPGPTPRPPAAAEHADIERAVAWWGGCQEIRERLLALAHSSASVVVFLEYFPQTLHEWLSEKISRGGEEADSAFIMTDRNLQATTSFMNSRGLLHFDAHFNNILTDGQRLYFTDFGLAMHSRFDLSGAETAFFASHRSYDCSYTVTHLVKWLKTAQGLEASSDPITAEYADGGVSACLPAAADAIIRRYTSIADITSDFYRRLHKDKLTPYPADEIERACAEAGLPVDRHRLDVPDEGQGG